MGKIASFFKAIKKNIDEQNDGYRSRFERNVKDACNEMVLRAKETTPPKPGTERGTNTVTGNLASHWGYKYDIKENDTRVTITNNVQYASYVDQGHRMDEHFVPWLYIDPFTGQLSKHIPISGEKLFGLVVGTKTKYVPGYYMVDKARERFFEVFDFLQKKSAKEYEDGINGDNH